MSTHVSIPKRYCGPPDSGNGGYVCGVAAGALGGSNVEVTLLAPPPLDRRLSLERVDQEVRLLDGQKAIAIARPTDEPVAIPEDAPPPVGYQAAVRAAANFDVDDYRAGHEYPGCYTCGPDRHVGDGLRIFPAATDRPDLYVWPWTPDPPQLGESGDVDVPVMWAALDCPSGLAWIRQDPDMGAVVLGKMAAVIHRTASPGEHLVVAGWTEPPQGRRRPARSAIYSETGDVLATSRATWVVLDDEQRKAFRSARP
jgi:hypothetical protein